MAGSTTKLALPYPTGTDRVMDGDNAMQALAERIEARMPWGCVAYSQWVADQGPIGGGNTLASITVPANVGAGRRIRLSCSLMFSHSIANGWVILEWYDGATRLAQGCYPSPPTVGFSFMGHLNTVIQSAAGAKTYTLYSYVNSGSATNNAATNRPSFAMAEDLGPWAMA